MGLKVFDAKFGADLIARLPPTPAVYLFLDDSGDVLYVGKAKNIRRRLSSYRNASRRKVHRKMRALVREASTLEVRLQDTERRALVLENQLIQELRPPHNVEGTYAFLYPAIGLRRDPLRTLLCFTTTPDAWHEFAFAWYGVFRSRLRAKEAFDELVALLALLGHVEKRKSLGPIPETPGSRIVGVRRLDAGLVESLHRFLGGATTDALAVLAAQLVEKPQARQDASEVQASLEVLAGFFQSDLRPLRSVLAAAGIDGSFVGQEARDRLFIEHR